jgi:hypothetical protein
MKPGLDIKILCLMNLICMNEEYYFVKDPKTIDDYIYWIKFNFDFKLTV